MYTYTVGSAFFQLLVQQGIFITYLGHWNRTCCREEANSDSTWNCFLDLLFVAFVIIIIQNGLPQSILPLCLTVKLKCLCSESCPPVGGRKEEINTSSCPRLAILGDCWQDWWPFYFVSSLPPLHLGSIKETGIQTLVRRLFWNISLPSSRTVALPLSRMLSCSQ